MHTKNIVIIFFILYLQNQGIVFYYKYILNKKLINATQIDSLTKEESLIIMTIKHKDFTASGDIKYKRDPQTLLIIQA